MRSAIAQRAGRLRSSSLNAVPPPRQSSDYLPEIEHRAASILYRSPLFSQSGLPVYILNAAAFPDAFEVDYDSILPYVLARLPGEDDLIAGQEYEVVFFAGGNAESATKEKKSRPGWGWFLQAYHVLSRATRKRLRRLYVVHERGWVRILVEMFSTIVSPKFRKKIVHASSLTHVKVNTISSLALHVPIEKLLIPPSAYLYDRKLSPDIFAPHASGRRAFSATQPLPTSLSGNRRLPRVLRETSGFVCMNENIRTEGLFRIPPHSRLLEIVREAYDRGQQFIVWKERSATYTQPGMEAAIVDNVRLEDAYGVHLAAALIKTWYRELQEPLIPQACYTTLRESFAEPNAETTISTMTLLLSPSSQSSCLPETSRLISCLHLLPLLATVASYSSDNKMSAENLAICFAPALVCGDDQLEDAKMGAIIRRMLEAAIEAWPNGLCEACGSSPTAFAQALQPPADMRDYEDPLEGERVKQASQTAETYGGQPRKILSRSSEKALERSSLPPGPPADRYDSLVLAPAEEPPLVPRRKPAPPLSVLPRYSAILADTNPAFAESPSSYVISTVSYAPPPPPHWTFDSGDGQKARFREESQQLNLPKRQFLTEEQHNNLDDRKVALRTRSESSAKPSAPSTLAGESVPRKPLPNSTPLSPVRLTDGVSEYSHNIDADGFAKSLRPASSPQSSHSGAFIPRELALQGLVRTGSPVDLPSLAASSSAQVAGNAGLSTLPEPRAPSLSLSQRTPPPDQPLHEPADRLQPHTLNMRKVSVNDLRRLYEERAGMTETQRNAPAPRQDTV
ncbi:hypothetical protein LTR50_003784 [Elasticomyces elasticus]|nr:hypothetical protein LTR50_003784 [Elasticomyces elasticus]